jgi:hypothetical protein
MKWLMSHVYTKHSALVFIAVLALTLTACNKSKSSEGRLPQPDGGVSVEVAAGEVQIGDLASAQSVHAGETVLLAKGKQLSTNGTDGAELALAGNTRLLFAPSAVIELAEWETDASVTFRQLNGVVTFHIENLDLTVTGSTGLAFGPDGLERVEFLAKALAENSLFVVNVDQSAIKITVEKGGAEVRIDEEVYQLREGESLSVKGLDQIEIGRALVARPSATPRPVEAETNNQPTDLDDRSGVISRPMEREAIVQPAIVTQAEIAPEASGAENHTQAPGSDDLSSSEAAPQPISPPDNARLSKTDSIKLAWQSEAALDSDTWYEMQLWLEGESHLGVITMIQETEWRPSEVLEPGKYQWQVRLIRLSDRQYLSPPSTTHHFTVIEPTPTPTIEPVATSTAVPTKSPTKQVLEPTPTPTIEPVATPTGVIGKASYPQPILVGPESDEVFAFEEPVVLEWQPVGVLGDNQWYEVRLWRNGTEWAGAVRVKESQWTLTPDYNPGRYGWRIAVITVENGEWAGDISPESETLFLTWEAPPSAPTDGGNDKEPPGSRGG